MKSLLIGGNPGRWSFDDPAAPFRETNGIEAWVYALQGDYASSVPADIADFDLVIGNLNPWLVPDLLRAATSRRPGQKWVSLIEGAGEDYFTVSPPLRALLGASDLVAAINGRTVDFLQSLTSTPVKWVGIPYPVETVASRFVPPDARREEVLICPRSHREPSAAVARGLGVRTRVYVPKVSRKLSNLAALVQNRSTQSDINVSLVPHQLGLTNCIAKLETELPEFWGEAAGCQVWINLDPRHTWGRFVLDAAALRVPIISTASTDHAPRLFPETTVADSFQISEATSIGKRLLSDGEFLQQVTDFAYSQLDLYRPETTKARLFEHIGF